METLAEIDSCISRLSRMGAQEAFFHPDFVRLLSLLKFPYLYDGNGTEVPKETIDKILLLVAEKAEAMPRQISDDDYSRYSNTCTYVLNALSSVAVDAGNADSFVRVFLLVAEGGMPPEPETEAVWAPYDKDMMTLKRFRKDDGGFFDAACHRDGAFQRMVDFRSPELCARIAERISGLAEPKESAIYLFSVALDHSSEGVELGIETVKKLEQFARRWKDAQLPSAQYKRTLDEGGAHFSGKAAEFERLASALLRQMKAAEKQRVARIYDMQEFRAKWKNNRVREAEITRDGAHFARRLRICSGRC